MLGLFGTLNLGARSLTTQRAGVEVAGQNLANVNNPAYARQRIDVATGLTIDTALGPQGTGADVIAIRQIRNTILDQQIQGEAGVRGSLEAQQLALNYVQSALGQVIDRNASGAEGASAALGVGGQHGIAEGLSGLFNAFESLSTDPSSLTERQALLTKAADLAERLNQTDARLANVGTLLDESLAADVNSANALLEDITALNQQILRAEITSDGVANDLRDARQAKLEELSQFVKFDSTMDARGLVSISVGGTTMVDGTSAVDRLEVFDAGGGVMSVRAASGGGSLTLGGGSIQGTMEVRDGALATLREDLNTLAATLISEVNAVHAAGFGLNGSTGEQFFVGDSAANIAVNPNLAGNPARVQASGVAGAAGNNSVALELAQLGQKRIAGLGNQTLTERYGQVVAGVGQSLSSVDAQLVDQGLVDKMLLRQRESISGVSIDEEMTDLTRFQKAFQASARLITTVDEMLQDVVNLKR